MIIINTVIGRRRGPECRQIGLHRQPHANVQLPEAATSSNLAGGLRKWAIQIWMARETRYINRIRIGRVARYKNRILFGSNGTMFHVYIIALGLSTGAPAGYLDPTRGYFSAQNSYLDPRRFFPTGHPDPWVNYLWVMGTYRFTCSQWVFKGTHRFTYRYPLHLLKKICLIYEKYIKHIKNVNPSYKTSF